MDVDLTPLTVTGGYMRFLEASTNTILSREGLLTGDAMGHLQSWTMAYELQALLAMW